jgi:hypothetical protein
MSGLVPRYEERDWAHIEAPRFGSGEYLGHYPCAVLRKMDTGDGTVAYLIRFEDGNEAAVYRHELRATSHGWANLIDPLDNETGD